MEPDPDAAVARILATLGSEVRLRILRAVRTPRSLNEIRVATTRGDVERPLARQSVQGHLEQLQQIGAVVTRPARRAYGETQEYMLNHQAIFALMEDVRGLARIRASVDPPVPTAPREGAAKHAAPRPGFVLVKGLDEGTTFDLRPKSSASGRWVIGRRRGVEVALDFDPSVSGDNAIVSWSEGRHVIEDVPGSRNGTSVNLRRLDPGERRTLAHGDLVGVGRCLLLYWA